MATLTEPWPWETDPFFSKMSEGGKEVSLIIMKHTNDFLYARRLDVDTRFGAAYTYFNPFYLDLDEKVTDSRSGMGQQVSASSLVKTTYGGMKGKLDIIEPLTLVPYAKGTPTNILLWHGGRDSFYHKSYESRSNRLGVFITDRGTDTLLAAAKALAVTYLGECEAARTGQAGKKEGVGENSVAMNTSIENGSGALVYVLGSLLQIFSNSPGSVGLFFDLIHLRAHPADGHYMGIVSKFTTHKITIHLPKAGETYELENTGTTPWTVGTSNDPNKLTAPGKIMNPGDIETVAYPVIGDPTKKFIVIQNLTDISGNYIFNINKP
jgi:hypothetical protein